MRHAIIADEGASVWLYLTEQRSLQPVADCWLFNTVAAPADLSGFPSSDKPPPAIQRFVAPAAQQHSPEPSRVSFFWSPDGNSVALFVEDELVGFICDGSAKGFSRYLIADCPWGAPMDAERYAAIFAPASST